MLHLQPPVRRTAMKSPIAKLSRNVQIDKNVAALLQKRLKHAQDEFSHALRDAQAQSAATLPALLQSGTAWNDYAVDFAQRAILFWDTMRQRGNDFREHQKKGLPPLLHFEYETVLDARKFTRPVNYTLLCIIPPKGVTVDPKRRPYSSSTRAPVKRAAAPPKKPAAVPAAPAASSAAKPKATAKPKPATRAKAPAAKPAES
jgi:hypothetical protein